MSVVTDVATYLAANSIGTVGTDLFYAYQNDIDGPMVCVLDTGGQLPDQYLPTTEPTFQIFVRSRTYVLGKAKLDAIRALLHQNNNISLVAGQKYFYFILAQSEGGHIGKNEGGFHEFSMNFRCRTR